MTSPLQFRKKPVEIEAVQFTGSNVQEIWDAFGADGIYGPTEKNPDYLILTTVHGDEAPARPGDWVIPDGHPGTFYPCKPDIFAATYEALSSPQPAGEVPNPVDRFVATVVNADQVITKEQRERLCEWMRANGIDPKEVSTSRPITIEGHLYEGRKRHQVICFSEYHHDEFGHRYADPRDRDSAMTVQRAVRQKVELAPAGDEA